MECCTVLSTHVTTFHQHFHAAFFRLHILSISSGMEFQWKCKYLHFHSTAHTYVVVPTPLICYILDTIHLLAARISQCSRVHSWWGEEVSARSHSNIEFSLWPSPFAAWPFVESSCCNGSPPAPKPPKPVKEKKPKKEKKDSKKGVEAGPEGKDAKVGGKDKGKDAPGAAPVAKAESKPSPFQVSEAHRECFICVFCFSLFILSKQNLIFNFRIFIILSVDDEILYRHKHTSAFALCFAPQNLICTSWLEPNLRMNVDVVIEIEYADMRRRCCRAKNATFTENENGNVHCPYNRWVIVCVCVCAWAWECVNANSKQKENFFEIDFDGSFCWRKFLLWACLLLSRNRSFEFGFEWFDRWIR